MGSNIYGEILNQIIIFEDTNSQLWIRLRAISKAFLKFSIADSNWFIFFNVISVTWSGSEQALDPESLPAHVVKIYIKY